MTAAPSLVAQDKSVRPGINDSFRDANVKEYVERFEVESREVFNRREEILKACEIQPGQTVADIGAGTGIFTRLFSKAVGNEGNVIAVDISQNFLDHIQKVAREQGQTNIGTLLCSEDSTKLPANTVDLAYICDTYHHFEYPFKTMDSLFAAMKPGGRVVLVDFKRIEGETSDWTMNHVRAGQEVFEAEVLKSGFVKIGENKELLKDNYFVIFQKPKNTLTSKPATTTERKLVFPIVDGVGGVLPRPEAVEQPRTGAKVVFDVTNDTKSADINKGLDRVARLLNLYG
jgi:ubiquinone/menaquinone biosynthesis C-methylase UbiE